MLCKKELDDKRMNKVALMNLKFGQSILWYFCIDFIQVMVPECRNFKVGKKLETKLKLNNVIN